MAAGVIARSPIAASITSCSDLLDGELARRVQVRAGAAPFGDDRALLVREQTDGLRAAGVDAENVHAALILCYAREVSCFTPSCAVRVAALAASLILVVSAGSRAGRSARAVGRAHDADVARPRSRRWWRRPRAAASTRCSCRCAAAATRTSSTALEPRPASLAAQPAFDPLATTIAQAHEAGLQVHAWINVNLVASAAELPAAREHVDLPPSRNG